MSEDFTPEEQEKVNDRFKELKEDFKEERQLKSVEKIGDALSSLEEAINSYAMEFLESKRIQDDSVEMTLRTSNPDKIKEYTNADKYRKALYTMYTELRSEYKWGRGVIKTEAVYERFFDILNECTLSMEDVE